MKLAHVIACALALPEVHEEPHFEAQSFRVAKKIFATLPPDGIHLHVMIAADDVPAAIARSPATCSALHWGNQLAGVRVVIADADPDHVEELLAAAWRRRASKRAVAAFDAGRGNSD